MSSLRRVISNKYLVKLILNKQMDVLEKYISKNLNVRINLTSQNTLENSVKLNVNGGTLIGCEENLPLNGKYLSFKGIPYAEPPIGSNRFKSPVPIQSYKDKILDCTKHGETSMQPDVFTKQLTGSESCLYLNVYTPSTVKNIKSNRLPVMVYIHGGAFIWGSGNTDEHSPEYLVQEGVIVVTINYRLSILGFLHFPSGGIFGNQGLRDQRLALRWVNENIEAFGGDPNNVTVFGHSAGAAAVHLHMMLPESKKYFHKAILQSGIATMDWFRQSDPEGNARRLANVLGYNSSNDAEIAEFLKNVEAKNLISKLMDVLTPVRKKRGLPIIFTAALDKGCSDAILDETVDVKLSTPGIIDIPVMMGVTEADGMVMVDPQIKRSHLWSKELGRFIPRTVLIDGDTENTDCVALGNQIKQFYFGDKPIEKKTFLEFMNFMSEYNFNIPMQSAAEFHTRYQHANSNLYYYQFSYDGELNMMKKLLGFNHKGANHGDELTYLFVMKMAEIKVSENSKAGIMRRKMCKLWTNFAKYSNPTPNPRSCEILGNVDWKPVKRHTDKDKNFTLDCLDINLNSKMIVNPFHERMQFWREIYEKYNKGFLKPKL